MHLGASLRRIEAEFNLAGDRMLCRVRWERDVCGMKIGIADTIKEVAIAVGNAFGVRVTGLRFRGEDLDLERSVCFHQFIPNALFEVEAEPIVIVSQGPQRPLVDHPAGGAPIRNPAADLPGRPTADGAAEPLMTFLLNCGWMGLSNFKGRHPPRSRRLLSRLCGSLDIDRRCSRWVDDRSTLIPVSETLTLP
jgi:hypothetical protein